MINPRQTRDSLKQPKISPRQAPGGPTPTPEKPKINRNGCDAAQHKPQSGPRHAQEVQDKGIPRFIPGSFSLLPQVFLALPWLIQLLLGSFLVLSGYFLLLLGSPLALPGCSLAAPAPFSGSFPSYIWFLLGSWLSLTIFSKAF